MKSYIFAKIYLYFLYSYFGYVCERWFWAQNNDLQSTFWKLVLLWKLLICRKWEIFSIKDSYNIVFSWKHFHFLQTFWFILKNTIFNTTKTFFVNNLIACQKISQKIFFLERRWLMVVSRYHISLRQLPKFEFYCPYEWSCQLRYILWMLAALSPVICM